MQQNQQPKNGKDILDICKVVNGMWQTSGGWVRIDTDNAVDSMLHNANAGLTTFDVADICKVFASHACVCVVIKRIGKQWDVSMDEEKLHGSGGCKRREAVSLVVDMIWQKKIGCFLFPMD
ncbi:hypothetical protein Patl1_18755 [Pistacia atlantica]|uniref:Uncharacterized protein n=1 Tax=Pistacia atlantica TaxID=434234 RepID=A0ACC1BY37_9ROSI|nr:hypothetical protein Patl1_18755 [Pistacia atlantica]